MARAESAARTSGNRAPGPPGSPARPSSDRVPLALVLVQIERVVIAGAGLAAPRSAELRAKGYAGQ